MFENGELINGDCLEEMKTIADGSIDMILCDLPYGTTACAWDSVIPFELLWEQYKRIIKPNGAIVLTAAMPFTAALAMSNPKMFRYSLVWDKVNRYTGALNANRMPLRRHEDVVVFYKKLPTYNKQYREGKPYKNTRSDLGECIRDPKMRNKIHTYGSDGQHNPCSIIPIKAQVNAEHGLHPTQKPVALFEYLIRTYTNEGDTVLDNCSGSGTTAIASENTGRKWVCIERDAGYFAVSSERIAKHVADRAAIAGDVKADDNRP